MRETETVALTSLGIQDQQRGYVDALVLHLADDQKHDLWRVLVFVSACCGALGGIALAAF